MNYSREISESPTGVQGPIGNFGSDISPSQSLDIAGSIIETTYQCPVHGTITEILSFNFGAIGEKYCLWCLRDRLRKTMVPLSEASIPPSDSSSVITLSRYEILRRENDEKAT
jgi:hypothetical protein